MRDTHPYTLTNGSLELTVPAHADSFFAVFIVYHLAKCSLRCFELVKAATYIILPERAWSLGNQVITSNYL
jgi:hypothetical protein